MAAAFCTFCSAMLRTLIGHLTYVYLNCRLKYTLLQISYDIYQDPVDQATYPDSSDLFDYLAENSSLDTNGESISSVSCPLIRWH